MASLYWAFLFFLSLRLATDRLGSQASLLATLDLATRQLSGDAGTLVRDALASNLAGRPFILSYFAGLVGLSASGASGAGKELLYSLRLAIPSILSPEKQGTLVRSPEELIHPLYGIWPFDGPNSIVVAGFDDWGIVGAVVYPTLVVILFSLYYRITRRLVPNPILKLVIWFALLFQLFFVEQSLSAVFVMLRDLTLIVGAGWLLLQLEGKHVDQRFEGKAGEQSLVVAAAAREKECQRPVPG